MGRGVAQSFNDPSGSFSKADEFAGSGGRCFHNVSNSREVEA